MAGTQADGMTAAQTNKAKHGEDFYREIGRRGGLKGKADGVIKGFAASGKAKEAGRIGGLRSKRTSHAVQEA